MMLLISMLHYVRNVVHYLGEIDNCISVMSQFIIITIIFHAASSWRICLYFTKGCMAS